MRKTAIALAALGILSAVTTALPQPALAHDWHHRGWEHEGRSHNNGAAIALGILGGIFTTAAIASSHSYAQPAPYYASPYYGYGGYGYYR